MVSSQVIIGICLVFIGCCSNVVFLELLIKYDNGAGNIITFVQFLFIAVEGLIFYSKCFTVKSIIPVKKYFYMVLMFFSVSVINNYAFVYKIPLPLHMIFRSGSLVCNMILGIIILKKEYPLSKYVSVVMVTVGIFMATLASASNAAQEEHTAEPDDQSSNSLLAELLYMGTGILLLVFALFMSSLLGIYQEVLYKEHGKHPKEAMFYTHAIPLLWFLFLYPDLSSRVSLMNKSDPVGLGTIVIPVMFIYLFMNGLTQYICIRGVFILTSECSSLVVTLVITLRKFISLLFSIFFFQNPFTIYHWIGTILVFTGTAIFTGLLQSIVSKISSVSPHTTKDDKQD